MEKVDFCPQEDFPCCKMSAKSHIFKANRNTLNLIFLKNIGCFGTKLNSICISKKNFGYRWVRTKKNVVYTKMSTISSRIVRKHCLHACDFFHVCLIAPLLYKMGWFEADFYDVRDWLRHREKGEFLWSKESYVTMKHVNKIK